MGTQFNGPTYLTNANLTCADFSRIDLSNGNAIFGESPLEFDRSRTECRTAFPIEHYELVSFLATGRFWILAVRT